MQGRVTAVLAFSAVAVRCQSNPTLPPLPTGDPPLPLTPGTTSVETTRSPTEAPFSVSNCEEQRQRGDTVCQKRELALLVADFTTCVANAIVSGTAAQEEQCYCDRESHFSRLCCNCWNVSDTGGAIADFRPICGRHGQPGYCGDPCQSVHLRGLALTRRNMQAKDGTCAIMPECPSFHPHCNAAGALSALGALAFQAVALSVCFI
eukprot:TRINITY_DN70909_c0_g1_i1.p1 TRINITY_DN70909_c0_g1~~TRINITY_DN70909_c0_g1_i1.p1  ORF type:complete len:206 (+),score=2.39 TRINITY_DN70909_c0_g1_i1:75-692(+)